jgi:pimeloyl-ACP methyl ester carboxylesterase
MSEVESASQEAVVLVHGLYMTGWTMGYLAQRLRKAGFQPYLFGYPSLKQPPSINAQTLAQFLRNIGADTIHLVGHSLGGVVIRHLFQQFPGQRSGRIILLSSPQNGSIVAQRLRPYAPGRWLMGNSMEPWIDGELPAWPPGRELGVIAGAPHSVWAASSPGSTRPTTAPSPPPKPKSLMPPPALFFRLPTPACCGRGQWRNKLRLFCGMRGLKVKNF